MEPLASRSSVSFNTIFRLDSCGVGTIGKVVYIRQFAVHKPRLSWCDWLIVDYYRLWMLEIRSLSTHATESKLHNPYISRISEPN
jgi:hypothetical protein